MQVVQRDGDRLSPPIRDVLQHVRVPVRAVCVAEGLHERLERGLVGLVVGPVRPRRVRPRARGRGGAAVVVGEHFALFLFSQMARLW